MESFSDYGIIIPAGIASDHKGEIRTICPQCSASRKKSNEKCLSVNIQKGVWFCHHDGWSGSLKKNKSDLDKERGGGLKKTNIEEKIKLQVNPAKWVIDYFKNRAITEKTLLSEKVCDMKKWMPQLNKEIPAIAFPYFKNDKLVNVKYRDLQKNMCQEKGAEKAFYRFDLLKKYEEIIFTEGEIDTLSFIEAGFDNVCSVPDGAPPLGATDYNSKFSYLESARELLTKMKKIYLAVDNDLPGLKLEKELVKRIGVSRCYKITWPKGCKDANDVLVKFGSEKLRDLVKDAKLFPIKGIVTIGDFKEEIYNYYEKGFDRGFSTGWKNLDEFFHIRSGEITVITGIPGHGKSELIDALIINLLTKYSLKSIIFSPENYPLRLHFAKLAEKYIGKPFSKIKLNGISNDQLGETIKRLDKNLYFFERFNEGISLDKILDIMKGSIESYNIKCCIIDPWNEVEHFRPSNLSETEYISESLTKLRNFARDNNVHVFLVAHPMKLYKNGRNDYPIPTPYDISGSAHWRNKADNIITIFRPVGKRNDNITEIHVQKVRFKEVGKPGMVQLEWDRNSGRFSPLSWESVKKAKTKPPKVKIIEQEYET